MDITEQDIFKIIGLEVTEEERLDIESGLYHAAMIEFLDNYLEAVIGKNKLDELNKKSETENLTLDALIDLIGKYVTDAGEDMNQEIKAPLNKVYMEFIQDQIDLLQQTVDGLEANDTKVIKQSLLKTLKDMFSNHQWDQMGDVFRKVDLYKIA